MPSENIINPPLFKLLSQSFFPPSILYFCAASLYLWLLFLFLLFPFLSPLPTLPPPTCPPQWYSDDLPEEHTDSAEANRKPLSRVCTSLQDRWGTMWTGILSLEPAHHFSRSIILLIMTNSLINLKAREDKQQVLCPSLNLQLTLQHFLKCTLEVCLLVFVLMQLPHSVIMESGYINIKSTS